MDPLVIRVFKGMLFYATDDTIRQQLQGEGLSADVIDRAVKQARGTYNRVCLHQK